MFYSSTSSSSSSPRAMTVASALTEALGVQIRDARWNAGRKLFELVQAENDRPFITPCPLQLFNGALTAFILHFEEMSRKKRQEFSNSFFKSRTLNDRYPFRLALVNEKFKKCVKSKGHKMTIVTRGFCYTAYFEEVPMWSLNCGVIYEIGFLPSRIGRLVVEGVEKEDLNNLDEMSYMFEDIEHLSIPLIPINNVLGIELIQSFDKSLKSLDCSALLLKNSSVRTLKLSELRVTNVSWVDDLNELFSFRTNSLIVNASPVLNVLTFCRLQTYNPLVQELKFVNTFPIDVAQLEYVLTAIFGVFPNLQMIEFECVKVVLGDVSESVLKFPEVCFVALSQASRAVAIRGGFEFRVRQMCYDLDVFDAVSSVALNHEVEVNEEDKPSENLIKRVNFSREFNSLKLTLINELLPRPVREMKTATPAKIKLVQKAHRTAV
ncbi:unnamed protein product [Bursaphelenchus xylophilus]|uniref:(pine wood nematode) hypothetical protein n=1 Tax=Bursaphelenchus xylophilus TaxID=6326 RepID=A0A1I7S425_BURXY|nr:unnamed protein product [Bursaphelenchus xylophilus]CAG9116650.1 unnamed protein product [Bursaphelenchus xylophilus]